MMATDLTKTFFDTFGIEQRQTCGSKRVCNNYVNYNDCNGCNAYNYPEITDRILLELICIWNKACLYPEDDIAPANFQKVTEAVLEHFVGIENYVFAIDKQEIKQQVRTLFKE